jgi:hypothetical protein
MFKKVLFVFVILLPLSLSAQERKHVDMAKLTNTMKALSSDISTMGEIKHLCFKGIPIDGSPAGFIGKLMFKGFDVDGTRGDGSVLVGRFANRDNSLVCVCSEGGLVYSVIVTLPSHENWSSMLNEYRLFKQSYEAKYGVCSNSVERFPSHIPEGTGREHNAFREGAAVYRSSFSVPGGTITMAVAPVLEGKGKFCLKIEYKDELNAVVRTSAFLEDL